MLCLDYSCFLICGPWSQVPGSYFNSLRKVGAQVFDKEDSSILDPNTPASPRRAMTNDKSSLRAGNLSPEMPLSNLTNTGTGVAPDLTAG